MSTFLFSRWPTVLWVSFWIGFISTGLYLWDNSPLYSPGWFWDEALHFFFGTMLAFHLIYVLKRRRIRGAARLSGWRWFVLLLYIQVVVFLIGGIWEIVEAIWDGNIQPNFPWFAKAQKSYIDTVIDIILNQLGAIFVVLSSWGLERWIYEKIYQDDLVWAEIQEMFDEVEELLQKINSNVVKVRLIKREIIRHFLRERFRKIGPILRELSRGRQASEK